jgi:hypothetical protein
MPTNGMTRFIGGVSVIPASGSLLARKWEESLLYKDQDIKNVRNVNCVDSKHRTKHKWTYYSWTVICVILWLLI